MDTEIKYIVTEEDVTIYWRRTDKMDVKERFSVYLDGKETAVTEKTHCTLSGLGLERLCRIQVIGRVWKSDILTVITGRRKRRIDVTAPPLPGRRGWERAEYGTSSESH